MLYWLTEFILLLHKGAFVLHAMCKNYPYNKCTVKCSYWHFKILFVDQLNQSRMHNRYWEYRIQGKLLCSQLDVVACPHVLSKFIALKQKQNSLEKDCWILLNIRILLSYSSAPQSRIACLNIFVRCLDLSVVLKILFRNSSFPWSSKPSCSC